MLYPVRFVTSRICDAVQWSARIVGDLSTLGDTVQKIHMKTSNDSVKERIATATCTRNKRHLSTFLNTKVAVNPTGILWTESHGVDRSRMPRVASC